MISRLFLFIAFCFTASMLTAQTVVHGTVVDSTSHEPLPGASVQYLRKGRAIKFTHTNERGEFRMEVERVEMGDQLQATMMGYGKRRCGVPMKGRAITLSLTEESFQLHEVQVQGGRIHGGRDTITYDLTRFTTERDNSLKDVLRRLPGVEVAQSGQIAYNGQRISRFTVEGLDLTGGRYNQLTENIRAKDVKQADIVENDQPIKALRDKVISNNVGINVTLKDEARDRFNATLRPYLLVGDLTHAGGTANVHQIGKKRQLMYDAAYNRKGDDISESHRLLSFNYNKLQAAQPPVWFSVPSLSAPLDEERMRFNTSQRYGVNYIRKMHEEDELRVAAFYLRSVIRQDTEDRTEYYINDAFGGDLQSPTVTSETERMKLTEDQMNIEVEHKVNRSQSYGSETFTLEASRKDGLSEFASVGGDLHTLSQQVRIPQIDVEGNIYRLFPLKKGSQLTWRSLVDYHHAVNDLLLDENLQRIRQNDWHTQHQVGWSRKRGRWNQSYTAQAEVENLHTDGSNTYLDLSLMPSWQYHTETLRMSMSPSLAIHRFAKNKEMMLLSSTNAFLTWKPNARQELTLLSYYSETAGSMKDIALDSYQRDYRTWYVSSGIIPKSKSLATNISYRYKRPIHELFATVRLQGSRHWSNTSNDLQIVDGRYYYTLRELHSHSDSYTAGGSVSKGFSNIHLKTSLGLDGTLSKGQQLSAGQWHDYTIRTLTITPGIVLSPSWCEIDYEGRFSFCGNQVADNQMATLFNWQQRLSLTSTIKNVDLSWKFIHHCNELQERPRVGALAGMGNTLSTLLSDASVTWRLKKLRFEACLNNIFNRKQYVRTTYSGISTSTSTYYIRPRELVVSAQFNL